MTKEEVERFARELNDKKAEQDFLLDKKFHEIKELEATTAQEILNKC